eukprot:m.138226 g.138226  ORF g.138226 m.138226 type:complete len:297 (+) comp29978_c0_seq2:266-1156(+)
MAAAMKRIMREAKELSKATDQYHAAPLEDNIFEWHFTIGGPTDTAFAGGRFHGRILLPNEYPMKPPSIVMLTPNGRFEVGRKICLSISAHHPESWQPSWSIRTMLMAVIAFLPTPGNGAIGALDYTDDERNKLASKSIHWKCPTCGVHMSNVLETECKAVELSGADLAAFNEMQQMGFSTPRSRTTTETSNGAPPTPTTKNASSTVDTVAESTEENTNANLQPPKAGDQVQTEQVRSFSPKPSASEKRKQQPKSKLAVAQAQPAGWSGSIAVLGVVLAIVFLVYRKYTRTNADAHL